MSKLLVAILLSNTNYNLIKLVEHLNLGNTKNFSLFIPKIKGK